MKYTVSVADKTYEVEIQDVHARPIIARVDGERFEVHPDSVDTIETTKVVRAEKPVVPVAPVMHQIAAQNQVVNGKELTAPLPGIVVEIFVKSGDEVETGNVVLIIEAMKMKNSIRSTRSGKISEVLVSAGQTVAHKQPLVIFE